MTSLYFPETFWPLIKASETCDKMWQRTFTSLWESGSPSTVPSSSRSFHLFPFLIHLPPTNIQYSSEHAQFSLGPFFRGWDCALRFVLFEIKNKHFCKPLGLSEHANTSLLFLRPCFSSIFLLKHWCDVGSVSSF